MAARCFVYNVGVFIHVGMTGTNRVQTQRSCVTAQWQVESLPGCQLKATSCFVSLCWHVRKCAFAVRIQLVLLNIFDDWFRHEKADAHIFPQKSANFCAADIILDLLRWISCRPDGDCLICTYLMYDTDMVPPLWLQPIYSLAKVCAGSLNDECAIWERVNDVAMRRRSTDTYSRRGYVSSRLLTTLPVAKRSPAGPLRRAALFWRALSFRCHCRCRLTAH